MEELKDLTQLTDAELDAELSLWGERRTAAKARQVEITAEMERRHAGSKIDKMLAKMSPAERKLFLAKLQTVEVETVASTST